MIPSLPAEWTSKCPKDYSQKHDWGTLGVVCVGENQNLYLIHKCHQCNLIFKERLRDE